MPLLLKTESPKTENSAPTAQKARHLYLHIPFCLQICPYCSFYKDLAGPGKADPLVEAVIREAKLFGRGIAPRTIFVGGGTGLAEYLEFRGVEEFTIEMNPATVTTRKADLLRSFGVNRVSMGVQSWDPHLLKLLGRVHDAEQVRRSFALLRRAGFDNLNLDLIYGVPGQTLAQWEESIRCTVALRPEHISSYCLTYEEDTEFFAE